MSARLRVRGEHLAGFGLRQILAGAMFGGAAVHLGVAVDHVGTVFGALSLATAIVQLVAGSLVLFDDTARRREAAALISVILLEAYVLNVTIGLPPLIAHAHLVGTHDVFGLTLSRPNPIDLQGIVACGTEVTAILAAAVPRRLHRRNVRVSAP